MGDTHVESFKERHAAAYETYRAAFMDYARYCQEREAGEIDNTTPTEPRSNKTNIHMEDSPDGYPLLPAPKLNQSGEEDLEIMRAMARLYLTRNYSECPVISTRKCVLRFQNRACDWKA